MRVRVDMQAISSKEFVGTFGGEELEGARVVADTLALSPPNTNPKRATGYTSTN